MAAELSPERRSSDTPRYTEADFDRFRRELTEQNRITALAGEVGKLSGQVAKIPTEMEATARRVFTEQWQVMQGEAKRQTAEVAAGRWRRADSVLAIGQFLLAAAVFAVAILK